jgi:hypothetical protein
MADFVERSLLSFSMGIVSSASLLSRSSSCRFWLSASSSELLREVVSGRCCCRRSGVPGMRARGSTVVPFPDMAGDDDKTFVGKENVSKNERRLALLNTTEFSLCVCGLFK